MSTEKVQADVREQVLASIGSLPPFPPVAARVLELMQDPDAGAADLARVVSRDQGLTAKILRASNSSYQGLTVPVTSLSHAMVLLGLRGVRDLILYYSLPLGRASTGKPTDLDRRLWIHAVATALGGRFLALRRSGPDQELAFLGGLFHDIGSLVLHQGFPAEYTKVCEEVQAGRGWIEVEREHLGIDHAELGRLVLERWELGPELAEVTARHHEAPEGLNELTRVVRAADELVDWMDLKPEVEAEPPNGPGSALHALGIGGVDLDEIAERLRGAVEKESQVFLSTR